MIVPREKYSEIDGILLQTEHFELFWGHFMHLLESGKVTGNEGKERW